MSLAGGELRFLGLRCSGRGEVGASCNRGSVTNRLTFGRFIHVVEEIG